MISDANEPTPLFLLRRCRDDEVEAVSELFEDDDGAGKQVALAVDLGADVLTDRGPPDVASRDEWR